MEVSQFQGPFEYVLNHLQVVGWPVVVLIAWKASSFLNNIKQRFEDAERTMTSIARNDLPHITTALESISDSMRKQDARWDIWMTTKAAQHHED